jgi:xanthine dehydrogenase YagS FAD-binding subunit
MAEAMRLTTDDPGATYLGGGTNLVDLMRLEVSAPSLLVDIQDIELGGIEPTEQGGLLIGATATNAEVAADARVRESYPILVEALVNGASPQLRNRATIAGNLLQRTRCAYFQDTTKPCNKREPGSGCPAIEGEHHNLAILGWSRDCVATHPSDMAVAMVLLDAIVHVRRGGESRTVTVEQLYRSPADGASRDTVLTAGDLITAVELPAAPPMRSAYVKARERASFSFALVSVAAAVLTRDEQPCGVRVALGGVAHRPWRARRAEQVLGEGPLDLSLIEAAAAAELAGARPLRDNGFKVTMTRNMIVRTVCELAEIS